MTCFRRKRMYSILTATISSVSCYSPTIHLIQCPGLSPGSLVQQNKNACLRLQQKFCYKLRSRICHKSRSNIKLYFYSPVYLQVPVFLIGMQKLFCFVGQRLFEEIAIYCLYIRVFMTEPQRISRIQCIQFLPTACV